MTLAFKCLHDLILSSLIILRSFFEVISMVEKSTLFPPTFSGVISLIKKNRRFHVLFTMISLVEISTVFLLTFFLVILMVEKSSLFARNILDKIWMDQNSTSFLVSCKLMKKFEEVFLC